MAGIDERELLPTVTPSSNVPNPAIHLDVNPGAFGGYQARGLEQLGQGAEVASRHWGEIAADDVANQFQERAEGIRSDYMKLQGTDALNQQPAYMAKLKGLFEEAQGKVGSFDQRRQFDNLTRRLRAVVSSQMDTHANTQRVQYGVGVNADTIKLGEASIAANPDDEDVFLHTTSDMVNSATKIAQLHGAQRGDPMFNQLQADAKMRAAAARVLAVGAKDPARALEMADHYKNELGTHYHTIHDHLRTRAEDEGADAVGRDAYATGGAPPAQGGTPGEAKPAAGVSPGMSAVQSDAVSALKAQGIDLNVTSGRRTPAQNAGAHGARDSQHLHGNAIDISLGGLDEAKQRQVVEQFLKDPRVKGFGYYPGTNSIHVDVREGANTAWGADHTSGSIGKGWPQWVTDRVNQWRGQKGGEVPRANMAAADDALHMTPQEKNLYQHHLDELGKGGVQHEDRSVSTLYQLPIERDGKWYNVPSVWDGEILWDDEGRPDKDAIAARVDKVGWDKFPAYGSPEEADKRYEQMHKFMEMDTQAGPRQSTDQVEKSAIGETLRKRAAAIESIANRTDLSATQKRKAIGVVTELSAADQLRLQADQKEKQDNNEKGFDEYVQMFAPGQVVPPNIVSRIVRDPRLKPETKEHLIAAAKARSGSDVENATMTYGPGFWGAFTDIARPMGDPKRISNIDQLIKRAGPGGDLTLAGVKELKTTLDGVRKSVDDNDVHQTKQHLMEGAKKLLSFEGLGAIAGADGVAIPGFAGLKDPDGERIFHNQFVPAYLRAYHNWVTRDGKDPWEFLTEENATKIAAPLRDKHKMERAKTLAAGNVGSAPENEPVPPMPSGLNEDTWSTLMKQTPIRVDGSRMPAQNWAKIVEYLRAHPDKDTQAEFDKKYGGTGHEAKSILESLKRPPKPPMVRGRAALPPRIEHPVGTTFAPGVIPERVPPPAPELDER